jgi:large subunit ribosomal protein L33
VFLDFSGLPARFDASRPEGPRRNVIPEAPMAKAASIKIKLVSSADTGFYYVAKKNSRTMTDKLVKKKYDPVAKKHVEFRES